MIRPSVLLISGKEAWTADHGRALEDAGLSVRHAPHGLDGMRQAMRDHPDLVVLDFAAEDATDVLRARRALRAAGIALLVVAPGEVSEQDRPGGKGVSFLAAPVEPERLAAEAARIVEARRRARERAGNNAG